TPELWRFAAGALAAALVTVGLATAGAGRGGAAGRGVGANTQGVLWFTPKNALGLDYALSFTTVPPPEGLGSNEVEHDRIVQSYRERTLEARAAGGIGGRRSLA